MLKTFLFGCPICLLGHSALIHLSADLRFSHLGEIFVRIFFVIFDVRDARNKTRTATNVSVRCTP
jgi:hypothetical protein